MKTKQTTKPRVARVPNSSYNLSDERTRAHRAINWVFSFALVCFAVWSILLNAEGRSLLKQSVSYAEDTDKRIAQIVQDFQTVKDVCLKTTVVIPTPTIDAPVGS